mgnify:CR=1 FL=1
MIKESEEKIILIEEKKIPEGEMIPEPGMIPGIYRRNDSWGRDDSKTND